MTEAELSAGADAVFAVAQRYGVAGWLSRDNLREIAAEVIAAHDRVHAEAALRAAREAREADAAKNPPRSGAVSLKPGPRP